MPQRRVTRGAMLAFVFVMTAWQIHCAEEAHFVAHRFDLEGCPSLAFSLPASIEHPRYRLRAAGQGWLSPGPAPICSGFKDYDLDERTETGALVRIGAGLQVRLNRGGTCSLDVIYSYLTGTGEAVPEIRPEELTRAAETVAQLVMSSAKAPRLPAAYTERFGSEQQLKQWCEQTVEGDDERGSPVALAHAFQETSLSVCR